MQPDFDAFFRSYVEAYNRSLGDSVDAAAIRSHFADSFIAAGPQGVIAGDNDETFAETLNKGYAFYKAIGTREMAVESVSAKEVEPHHFLAKVSYRATYDRKGDAIVIPFTVTYLVQQRGGQLKIFAFMAGDEMGLYRQHGLVDADGNPTG